MEENNDEDRIKSEIFKKIGSNLTLIRELILSLKEVPIDTLLSKIDTTAEQLTQLSNDLEKDYEQILKYNENK